MVTITMTIRQREGSEAELKAWDDFYNKIASKNPPPKTAPGDEQKKVENGTSKKR
jgi:hypothetical protein